MGALMKWLNREASAAPQARAALHSVDELRRRSLDALADCTRPQAERIRAQLAKAATPQQLWLTHADIYQAVARQHCEFEAARRISALSAAFAGWLPPGALKRR
jgi:hypothetical protein